MKQITQQDIDSLSPQKKRIYSIMPESWTDARMLAQSLAQLEQVHLPVSELVKQCHYLSKQGMCEVNQHGRESFVRRIQAKQVKPTVKKEVLKVSKPQQKKEVEPDRQTLLSRMQGFEEKMLQTLGELSVLREDIDKFLSNTAKDEEMLRLLEVEDKYNKLRELLK